MLPSVCRLSLASRPGRHLDFFAQASDEMYAMMKWQASIRQLGRLRLLLRYAAPRHGSHWCYCSEVHFEIPVFHGMQHAARCCPLLDGCSRSYAVLCCRGAAVYQVISMVLTGVINFMLLGTIV